MDLDETPVCALIRLPSLEQPEAVKEFNVGSEIVHERCVETVANVCVLLRRFQIGSRRIGNRFAVERIFERCDKITERVEITQRTTHYTQARNVQILQARHEAQAARKSSKVIKSRVAAFRIHLGCVRAV